MTHNLSNNWLCKIQMLVKYLCGYWQDLIIEVKFHSQRLRRHPCESDVLAKQDH